jgi:hypothetical protein
MQETRARDQRPSSSNWARAMLTVGLLLAAWTVILGAGSSEAWALVIPPWEVDPAVGYVRGQVESSDDGGTTWAPLPLGGRVPPDSLVRTGVDGNCVLFCTDDCLVAMKADTTIQVLPQLQALRLQVLAGEAWVRFHYVVESERNAVGLPLATVSATTAGDYSFEVNGGASTTRVLQGSSTVVLQGGDAQVSLSSGQTLEVGPNGPGPATAFDVALERSGWQGLLEQAGVPVTTTSLPGVTATDPLPPDGPVGTPKAVIVMLLILGTGVLGVLAGLGTLIYRLVRRRRGGQP